MPNLNCSCALDVTSHGIRHTSETLLVNHTNPYGMQVYVIPIWYCYTPGSWMLQTFGAITFMPVCMGFMSGLFTFYSFNIKTMLLVGFTYLLWLWAWFIQGLVASPRPHPECVPFVFLEYGLPAAEIVYLTSTVTAMACYWFLLEAGGISYLQVITFAFLLLLYPYMHYIGLLTSATQAFLSLLFGVVPTLLFSLLLRAMEKAHVLELLSFDSMCTFWSEVKSGAPVNQDVDKLSPVPEENYDIPRTHTEGSILYRRHTLGNFDDT